MQLFHGSPYKLNKIIPNQAKGINDFESQPAVYLTDSKLLAKLYAVSKHLKGKTKFAVFPFKIIIVGNFDISDGYVYEVNVDNAERHENHQFSYFGEIKSISNVYKINKHDMQKYVYHVDNEEDFKVILKRFINDF
jgi:hypothetical protein